MSPDVQSALVLANTVTPTMSTAPTTSIAPADLHTAPADLHTAPGALGASDLSVTPEARSAPGAPDAVAPAPDPAPAPVDPHADWSRVLDELAAMSAQAGPDAGIDVMNRLVRWSPPTDLGRLPAVLVDRALEVLAGHAHVVEHLHEAVAENRRHVRALSAVPTVHDAPAAAYLDVQA